MVSVKGYHLQPSQLIAALVLVTLGSLPATAACNIINGQAYGDCSNVTISRTVPLRLEVREDRFESNIIAGAEIFPNASLSLSGMSNGDITVRPGGTLRVSGMVNGRIINQGGIVTIEGTADAVTVEGGKTHISGVVGRVDGIGIVTCEEGAIISGRPQAEGVC